MVLLGSAQNGTYLRHKITVGATLVANIHSFAAKAAPTIKVVAIAKNGIALKPAPFGAE
jgi:hypothetical protein